MFKDDIENRKILDDTIFEEKSRKIKLKKDMNMSEIESQLKEKFNYDQISIVIKKTLRNGIIRPEILNMKELKKQNNETQSNGVSKDEEGMEMVMKNQSKTLGNLCVSSQYVLFLDGSPSRQSQWAKYFRKENNMIVLNFNYPLEEKQNVDNVKYPFRLKVDMRKSLTDLKEILEDYINNIDHSLYKSEETKKETNEILEKKDQKSEENVNVEALKNETYKQLVSHQKNLKVTKTRNLIMKKGGKSGVELKDLSKTLRKIGFINNSYIFLRFGRQAVAGEIKVNLFFCLDPLQSTCFSLKRQIHYFGETYILNKLNASQVLDKLKKEYPVLESKQLLLREKNLDVLTKVFRNYSLKGQYVFDRKNLVIEESNIRIPHKDEVFIYYTILKHVDDCDIDEIEFKSVKQMVVNKQHNLGEMGQLILENLKEQIQNQKDETESHIEDIIKGGIEILSCTKIRDVANFEPLDILGHKFFKMNRNDQLVSSSPFYLENDGCLFILKKKGVSFSNKLRQGSKKNMIRNKGFFNVGCEQNLQIFVKTKNKA
jgi:hypothetical protein